MKVLRFVIAALILTSLFLLGCGGSEQKAPAGPKEVFQPNWYNLQDNPEMVYSYGNAEKVSQNASEAAALANAYAEAAMYVENYVKTMTKNFISEAGVDNPEVTALTEQVTKLVAQTKFVGAMVTERKTYTMENGRYKTFVRLAIPKADVQKNLVDRIKREEALYNRFRASQSFEELDKETGGNK